VILQTIFQYDTTLSLIESLELPELGSEIAVWANFVIFLEFFRFIIFIFDDFVLVSLIVFRF